MTAALATGLYWQIPARNPDRVAELDAAAVRYRERTGLVANVAACHPGEAFVHPTIAVTESNAVSKGYLFVGVLVKVPRREPTFRDLVCAVPARPIGAGS